LNPASAAFLSLSVAWREWVLLLGQLSAPDPPFGHAPGKVLLVNLAKGRHGEDSSSLLGGLLVTTIGLAAYTRADIAENQRKSFFAYIDEFQSFTTMALANMLSELRKYRVRFTIAHQYMHQLDPDIRHAVLGNTGTIISFRVGAEDAPYLAREFVGQFDETDLVQLPNYSIYLKLMIDGSPSQPFSARTLNINEPSSR
jgi:type IV secretory pathway TraG/TraD family ATPase VirD4